MADVNNIVDWNADENDDTGWFYYAEFATHYHDATQDHKDDASYAHDGDEADLNISGCNRQNNKGKRYAD